MTPATGKGSLGLGGFALAEGIDAASDLAFDLDVSVPSRAPPGGYRLAAQVDDGDDLILGSLFRVVD